MDVVNVDDPAFLCYVYYMHTSEAQAILNTFGYLQYGLVTSAQAADSGIDSTTMTRLSQRDIIRRVRRGVYILAGVAEDALTEIRAAWLATSPQVLAEDRLKDEVPIVVSHVSAASVLDLGDITPAKHMFSSPLRKQSSAADIRHRIAALPDDDITVVEGIPVTTALRTVVDLARVSSTTSLLTRSMTIALRSPAFRSVLPLMPRNMVMTAVKNLLQSRCCDSQKMKVVLKLPIF